MYCALMQRNEAGVNWLQCCKNLVGPTFQLTSQALEPNATEVVPINYNLVNIQF